MRIHERGGRQRGLDQLFIPEEPRRVMPAEISEEIILIHPAVSSGTILNRGATQLVTGPAGVTVVNGFPSNEENNHWIHAAQLTHTDPIARELSIAIEEILSGRVITVILEQAVPNTRALAIPRSLVLGELFRLQGRADAIAAGETLQLTVYFAAVRLAEEFPRL